MKRRNIVVAMNHYIVDLVTIRYFQLELCLLYVKN